MAVAGVLGGVLAGVIGSGIENGGCDGGIGGDAQIVELEGHFLVAAECEAGVVDGVGDVGDAGFLVLGQLVESCFAVCDEAAVRLDGEVFVVELHGLVADGHLFEGVGVRTNRVEVDCGELQGCFAFVVDQDSDVADGDVLVGGRGAIDCCYLVGGLGDLASTASAQGQGCSGEYGHRQLLGDHRFVLFFLLLVVRTRVVWLECAVIHCISLVARWGLAYFCAPGRGSID